MARAFISAADVAAMLGLTDSEGTSLSAAFLRRRERLEREEMFPLPMPTSRRPLLWKADEVRAWIDLRGGPALPAIDPALIEAGKVTLLNVARA